MQRFIGLQRATRILLAWSLLLVFGDTVSAQNAAEQAASGPLNNWTQRHIFPTPEPLIENGINDVAFGAGTFVAVGDGGCILTSTNGRKWIRQTSGTTYSGYAIAFGNGRFVAGFGGHILVSTNGSDWSLTDGFLPGTKLVFANGKFFAMSRNFFPERRSPSVSEDGIHWTTLSELQDINGVAYGNGRYMATGMSGYAMISTNGLNWTPQDRYSWGRLAYGNGRFVSAGMVSIFFTPGVLQWRMMTSPDGSGWAPVGVVDIGTSNLSYSELIFAGGRFVLSGHFSFGSGVQLPPSRIVRTSTDGLNWSWNVRLNEAPIEAITYGNGVYVAVSRARRGMVQQTRLIISENGEDWIDPSLPLALRAVTFGNGNFVTVGDQGTVLTSTNGADWIKQAVPSVSHLLDVSASETTFVAVGSGGTILSSRNGIDWISQISGTILDLSGVTYGQGRFVAVGGVGGPRISGRDEIGRVILTSRDGIEWTETKSYDFLGSIRDVTYGDSFFFATGSIEEYVGTGASIDGWVPHMIYSPDGIEWSRFRAANTPIVVDQIASGNGSLMALGTNAISRPSSAPDAAWLSSSPAGVAVSGIGFGPDLHLALGRGTVSASTNGTIWQTHQTGSTNTLFSVAFGHQTLVAVGENGTILQSGEFARSLKLTTPSWSNNEFQTLVETSPGHEYILEYKNTMNDLHWMPAATISSSESRTRFSDTNAIGSTRFYRLRQR